VNTRLSLFELLRRPEVAEAQIAALAGLGPEDAPALEQAAILARYEGYIAREAAQVEAARRQDHVAIPPTLDYGIVPSLSAEAKEKMTRLRPVSLGQAARIPGITPADVSVLALHLAALGRKG